MATQDETNLLNLKAAYSRLCTREVDSVTLPGGKSIKYVDRNQLLKEIKSLETKLGEDTPVPRILERY
jgi:hypothetical protein